MRYIGAPYLVAFAVFLIVSFGIGPFVNSPTCEDGWRSQSIGRQGACSHHGGVRYDPLRYLVIPGGLLAGFLSYSYVASLGFVKRGTDKYSRRGKVICPRCGSEMKLRTGRYGEFYGCKKYPHCKSTLNKEYGEK